jgi:hypothetical protein
VSLDRRETVRITHKLHIVELNYRGAKFVRAWWGTDDSALGGCVAALFSAATLMATPRGVMFPATHCRIDCFQRITSSAGVGPEVSHVAIKLVAVPASGC